MGIKCETFVNTKCCFPTQTITEGFLLGSMVVWVKASLKCSKCILITQKLSLQLFTNFSYTVSVIVRNCYYYSGTIQRGSALGSGCKCFGVSCNEFVFTAVLSKLQNWLYVLYKQNFSLFLVGPHSSVRYHMGIMLDAVFICITVCNSEITGKSSTNISSSY